MNRCKKEKKGLKAVKKFFIVLLILLSSLLFLSLILYCVFFLISPNPSAHVVRAVFKHSPAKAPENIDDISARTIAVFDVEYPSDYPDNLMDIYLPKENKFASSPVIIWIHGGAFVGGDKSDTRFFARTLASEGYAVFTINYRLAPEEKYPTPFLQLNDAYHFIYEQAERYQLDMHRLFLAGDSAGAQIAGQTANALTNESYKNSLPFQSDIPEKDLKGLLLYCGIFSVGDFSSITSNHFLVQLFKMIGWSYFGEKNWRQSSLLDETDVIAHVTEDFPPAFITDGNTMSFESLAKMLVQRLDELGTAHDSLFFPIDEYETKHEYQFVQNTDAARSAVERTLAFLEKYS